MTSKSISYDSKGSQAYLSKKFASPIFKYVDNYSLLNYIGDVRGKTVLDIGCGDGHLCRTLKNRGAKEVLGVDISEPMIQQAQAEERKTPLGIQYRVADARNLREAGQFDLVTANYVIHYASNVQDLLTFVQSIRKNLKPRGLFAGCNTRYLSELPFGRLTKYGRSFTKLQDIAQGARVKTAWTEPGLPEVSVLIYSFEREVYENIFKACGFSSFAFGEPLLAEEGKRAFPQGFWDEYITCPHMHVLLAS